eukprot:gene19383-23047_t
MAAGSGKAGPPRRRPASIPPGLRPWMRCCPALVWPTLARLAAAGERIVLVAPPYTPYPHAWQNAGVDVRQLSVIQADERDALWAVEQCLRSGSCGAVLCWPRK